MDFVVIDTEGRPELREVAILDSQGQLIYEAFSADHPENDNIRLKLKPLKQIVQDIATIARSKRLVCHHAKHDMEVLRYSFRQAQVPWINFTFACTWELAKQHLPNVESYSLEHLSQYLHLKVNGKRFNSNQAHTAYYDAQFTYQLYSRILTPQQTMVQTQSRKIINPFSSSRVDNPFQDHIDFDAVYRAEFELLKSILDDIKADRNQQSKGAIIIGEPGSGKTHLIMRMAKELLQTNRLLFIRRPNNAKNILHHTYSRILESFAQNVPGKDRTQLELLVANSFVKILSSLKEVTNTQKGEGIITALQQDALSLFNRLGTEGTQRHRESWQYIERHINEWWSRHYAMAGYSSTILKGIVKFCTYSDQNKKDLVRRWLAGSELDDEQAENIGLNNWQGDISREEFALEAISVFGKLSTLDEPLIIVFDQLEGIGAKEELLESFGDAVKEILTHVPNSLLILNLFPARWEQFKQYFDGSIVDRVSQCIVKLNLPGSEQLKEILSLKAEEVGIELDKFFNPDELESILDQNSIRAVLNRASDYFRYKVDNIPLPEARQPSIKNAPSEFRVEELQQIISQMIELGQSFISKLHQDKHLTSKEARENGTETKTQKPSTTYVTKVTAEKSSKYTIGATVEESSIENEARVKEYTHTLPKKVILLEYKKTKKLELIDNYFKPTIITDADELGKLAVIAEAFKLIYPELEFYPLRLGKNKLPEHFSIKTSQKELVIGFLNVGGNGFAARIRNLNQLVVTYPRTKFFLTRDAREPKIGGTVGVAEIGKLNHSSNGRFKTIEQEDCVNFNLIYSMIIDIQEKDLEVDLATALRFLTSDLSDYWLIQALQVRDER